jgi:hypothetical protein
MSLLPGRAAGARVTWTWALLSALTAVSAALAWALEGAGRLSPGAALTITVLTISAVKTRLVIREFMEVRTAPAWLRRATDAWLAVLMAAIIGLYLLGHP